MEPPSWELLNGCPKCGSSRFHGIDWEFDVDSDDDVNFGWECEDCGYCESSLPAELSTCSHPEAREGDGQ